MLTSVNCSAFNCSIFNGKIALLYLNTYWADKSFLATKRQLEKRKLRAKEKKKKKRIRDVTIIPGFDFIVLNN